MIYKLKFTPISNKEWKDIDNSIKIEFQKKLRERIKNPRVLKDKLSGYDNIYKIKLRSSGFGLAYEVKNQQIIILVLSVVKRENNKIYNNLKERLE